MRGEVEGAEDGAEEDDEEVIVEVEEGEVGGVRSAWPRTKMAPALSAWRWSGVVSVRAFLEGGGVDWLAGVFPAGLGLVVVVGAFLAVDGFLAGLGLGGAFAFLAVFFSGVDSGVRRWAAVGSSMEATTELLVLRGMVVVRGGW